MLDRLTQRIMESLHRSAQETIVPVKEVLKKNVNTQVDIGGKILKLGTVLLLFFGVLKIGSKEEPKKQDGPSTIIVNNYLMDPTKAHERRPE